MPPTSAAPRRAPARALTALVCALAACGTPSPDTLPDRALTPISPNRSGDVNLLGTGDGGTGSTDAAADQDGGAAVDAGPDRTSPMPCGGDTEGDGQESCQDACPDDADKLAPGRCGCGVPDDDGDGDDVPDCNDGCPNDPGKAAPGECGCGLADEDQDGNGVLDCREGVDPSFGQQGQFVLPSSLGNDVVRDALTGPDGSIFLVGDISNGKDSDVALIKLTPDGALDESFNGNGVLTKGDLAGDRDSADQGHSISLAPDGDLIVGGQSSRGKSWQGFLWKVSTDGRDDLSFGDGGVFLLDAEHKIGQLYTARVDPTSGKVVIVAAAAGSSAFRVLADGSGLDPSFSGDGVLNLHNRAIQPRMLLDENGELFVAASASTDVGGRRDGVSWRVDGAGQIVSSYGDPLIHADLASPGGEDNWRAVVRYDADRVLLMGLSGGAGTSDDEVVARVHVAEGSLDTSFGEGKGFWTEDVLGVANLGRVNAGVVEDDGSIVLALEVRGADDDFDAAVIKLDAQGRRVRDYARGAGIMLFGGDHDERSPRLVRQPSGRKLLLTSHVDEDGSDIAVWAIR